MEDIQTLKCYIDESGTGKPHKYMVIGGIVMERPDKEKIDEAVENYCAKNGIKGEIKWKKTNSGYLSRYKEIVSLIRGFTTTNELFYKCVVIDISRVDHRKFNLGDAGLGYYKFLYQLVLHSFGSYIRERDKMMIRIDEQTVDYSLSELREILNNGFRKKYEHIEHNPVVEVQPRDSKKCRMTQIADLLTGAICCAINLPIIEQTLIIGEPKRELSRHVLETFRVKSWEIGEPFINSPMSKHFFSIWHFRLSN